MRSVAAADGVGTVVSCWQVPSKILCSWVSPVPDGDACPAGTLAVDRGSGGGKGPGSGPGQEAIYLGNMQPLKGGPLQAVVKNGRLTLDEPSDLPEGEVVNPSSRKRETPDCMMLLAALAPAAQGR